jgi:hypothetical protein
MRHPDVGLEVHAAVALAVDSKRWQAPREDVLAALGVRETVHASHSATVPVIRIDRGTGMRISPPTARVDLPGHRALHRARDADVLDLDRRDL